MQNYYPEDAFPKSKTNSINKDDISNSSSFDMQSLMKLVNSNKGKDVNLEMLMTLLKNQNPQLANLLPLLNGLKLSHPSKSVNSKKNNTDNKFISVSKYYEKWD